MPKRKRHYGRRPKRIKHIILRAIHHEVLLTTKLETSDPKDDVYGHFWIEVDGDNRIMITLDGSYVKVVLSHTGLFLGFRSTKYETLAMHDMNHPNSMDELFSFFKGLDATAVENH